MAAKIDTDDLVSCPICFEKFTNPKCLPCHHTFCLPCLNSYIITHLGGEGKKAKEFPCPVCRQEVTVMDQTLTSDKIADTMPGNHLITSLIEKSETDQSTDEKLCGLCTFRNKKITAISWCKQCLEALCENCAYHHEGFRRSKHEIIPIEDMAKEKSMELLDVDEPCMKHTGKVLEVYCVDHKEMCCVICLATSHRKCEYISTFDEMVTSTKDTESVEQFADGLTDIKKKADCLRIGTDESLSRMNIQHDEISKEVTTIVQQAKDKLDHLQSGFLTKFKQRHKQESIKLTEIKERIEIFLTNVSRGEKLMKAVREQGSPKQMFITKEKLKSQLKHQIEGLQVHLKDAQCVDYTLNTDSIVTSVLNSLTSVAEVDVKPTLDLSCSLKEVSSIVNSLYRVENCQIDIMNIEVSKERSIQLEGITGGTCLPNGTAIFCSNLKSKSNLQAYDETGNYLFKILCTKEGSPTDVCVISANTILVSFYMQTYLKKYEIRGNTFKEMCTIPCRYGPWGLAATNDHIIVGFKNAVEILSMDGKIMRTFERKGDYVSYVAVSLAGNVYYNDGNDVMCKTIDGVEVKRFTNPNLHRLTGIAVDRYEKVYVCGYKSNNVCVFSADGQHNKVIVTDIKTPCKIWPNPMEKIFYIVTDNNGIYVYDIE